jgi:site-specific recombinase XerD
MDDPQLSLFKQRFAGRRAAYQQGSVQTPTTDVPIGATLRAYYASFSSGGYSKYTAGDFLGDVKKLARYVPRRTPASITTADLQAWISSLRDTERLTEKTISRKITAVKHYFAWLVSSCVLEENPADAIPSIRVTAPLPHILSESECAQLRAQASADPRTYLLVLLLLETGIKKEELFGLAVTHFDFSNKYRPEVWIKHTGRKIKKDRKLYLPAETVSVFEAYRQRYRIATHRCVELLLADVTKAVGITKRVTAQILRDTYAVRQLKSGECIENVLKKLGLHSNVWDDAKHKYLKLASPAL